MASAFLPHRGVLRISGDDKREFLQGLVTQDMRLVTPETLLYGCFLTPQGKYLVDFFITQSGDDFLLDVDRAFLSDFIKRLSMFKLRSRITITEAPEYKVCVFWNGEAQGLPDPRAANIGSRLITTEDVSVGNNDYTLWQLQNGLPDKEDFVRERSMMLEMNMDQLHAIAWDKGCYMGQELTARTHYRGLIKKRALPLKFTENVKITKDSPVTIDAKTVGYTLSQHNHYALALLQIEVAKDKPQVMIGDQTAEIIVPEWFLFDGD